MKKIGFFLKFLNIILLVLFLVLSSFSALSNQNSEGTQREVLNEELFEILDLLKFDVYQIDNVNNLIEEGADPNAIDEDFKY